jgi:glycosyltransferase involved in cell wall biosynthesis
MRVITQSLDGWRTEMIVITQSLDSMLAHEITGDLKTAKVNQIFTEFDHVVLLTQDTENFTKLLTGIEHVPCAFSQSKSVRQILSRFKYLRWIYFFFYSFLWILKHRKMVKLLVAINIDSPAPLLSLLFGIPCVVYYHYDTALQVRYINKRPIIGTILLFLERFAFKRAIVVWITSPSLMAKAKMFGAKRVRIIPNWIDIKEIEAIQTSRKKSVVLRILFVGRLHRVKQIDLLIRAFHLVHERNPDIELYILGDGEQRQNLVKLANDLGLSDSIHFEGHVDQMSVFKMMKLSDVFVLPSKVEGNPRVLIEAMVNKVPIVATNVPGIKEMIQHKKTGYLSEGQEPEKLAYAIECVIRNKSESSRVTECAYAFAIKNFSKENVLGKIRDELQLLLSKNRTPSGFQTAQIIARDKE